MYPLQAAELVLELFPPRGIIRLLPSEHTELGPLKMERLVAEEFILDTIHFFEADRVECARRLAKGLQLPSKHESLLAEMLFSQMLRVPQPQLKPLAYSTLMVRSECPPHPCLPPLAHPPTSFKTAQSAPLLLYGATFMEALQASHPWPTETEGACMYTFN